MRRTVPLVLTFIVGCLVLVNSYFIWPALNAWVPRYINRTVTVSTAWAVALGSYNLLRLHITRSARKAANWQYSVLLLVFYGLFFFFGIFMSEHQANPLYNAVFMSIQPPLMATLQCVMCFYLASAAYRAFRLRSSDSIVMMVSAFILMLGAVPIGAAIWPRLPDISAWITANITTATQRAMSLGIILGSVAQSMRVLTGVERGHIQAE